MLKLICIVSFQFSLSLGDKSKHIDSPSFDFRGVKLLYTRCIAYTFTVFIMADELDGRGFVPDFSNTPKEKLLEVMRGRGSEAMAVIEEKFGGVKNIIHELHTSAIKGIIGFDESVRHRQEVFGRNIIPLDQPRNVFNYLLCAMKDWVILILFAGALISVILGALFPEKCEGHESFAVAMYEGIGIMSTLVVMILLIAFSDYLKESDFRSLHSKINRERKVKVIRSGKVIEILARDIVVGDLCQLNIGTLIPADGVIVQQNELFVNESALTGQRSMVPKTTNPLAFAGTHIVDGSGRMVVIAVGPHTQMHMRDTRSPTTPSIVTFRATFPNEEDVNVESVSFEHKEDTALLQGKINKIQVALGHISIVLALVSILVIIIHFSVHTFSTMGLSFEPSHINEYIRSLIIGVVVLIIAVPEALSLVISTSLAFCVKTMYHDRALVRHVNMLETMGNITNICCNKTGVLTQNRMVVAKSYIGEQAYENEPRQYKDSIPQALFEDLCKAISVNTSYATEILVC